jgi:hypothetical protein
MSSIRETVHSIISEEGFNSYVGHPAVDAAVTALEERESEIVTRVREHLLFSDENDVEEFLVDVRLVAPTPKPEPELTMTLQEQVTHLVGVVDNLTDMIARLVRAANSRGITV